MTSRRLAPSSALARPRAFTLVEMMIVVLIIGILTAAAAPRFADSLSRFRAEAAAQRIKLDLELVRRQAKISSASRSIQFDPALHFYSVPGAPHLDRPDAGYTVKLNQPPYQALLLSADFDGDSELVFDAFGIPKSGGALIVQSGKHQKTITVDPQTGRASIE